mmetsp:Transcript_52382/g.76564  ORF Transcript_52382/g.76564 Transcript_52382/m.76564 type:complete len:92 (+) Transcript_52382:211-486(+)
MFQGSGIQLCDILELAAVGAGAVVAPLFVLQSGQRLLYEEVAVLGLQKQASAHLATHTLCHQAVCTRGPLQQPVSYFQARVKQLVLASEEA